MKRRNHHLKKYAFLCAIFLLITGCAGTSDDVRSTENGVSSPAAESNEADEPPKEQGTALFPSFTAADLNGNSVTESIFGEKDLTVLNIWGTFCGPCIGEMPELGEWAKEMPENVQMLGLIIDINGEDDTEHLDLAVDITQKAGADFTNLIANADFAPILREVIGVPTTLFIDGDGRIVGDPIVGADVEGYKQFVEEYLDGQ